MSNKLENMNQSEKILVAAFKCISQRGYANVSLRNIADEANVVLSQLNYYYKNKEGLFSEIIKKLSEQYLSEIEDNLKKGKSKKEKITCLIGYFQEVLRKKPELFRLLFDLTSMAFWSKALQELQNDLFNNLVVLIEKYIFSEFSCEEKLKNTSPEILSRTMLGTLFGTSMQVILADEKEDIIDSLLTLKGLYE